MDEKPIHKLTQEPVSDKFMNVLERLRAGEEVPMQEINSIDEIQSANARLLGRQETINIEGRGEIQKDVYNRLQKMGSAVAQADGTISLTGEVRREKRLDLIIGLPAAGKSSAVAEPISELFKSRIIDCDEAKKILPGYDKGWGAQAVHRESQIISQWQLNTALRNGENITYPRVGAGYDTMKKVIDKAKSVGYKVYVHYNELDRNKALGRMLERFLTTGRYLAPNLIANHGDDISNTYKQLKQSGIIEGFTKWSNDVPFGERPIPIEHSASCNDVYEALRSKNPETLRDKSEMHDAVVEKLTARVKELEAETKEVKAKLNKAQAQLNKTRNICCHLPKEFQEKFAQKRDELYPKYDPKRALSIDVPKQHKPLGGSGTKR